MRISRFEFSSLSDFRGPTEHYGFEALVEELEQEVIAELPPAPTFSEAQIATARAEGLQLGREEGLKEGLEQVNSEAATRERETLLALQTIERNLSGLTGQYDQRIAEQSREITQFILAVARKIAGEALTQRPELAVQELIRQCLPVILAKPRLIIETHSSMTDSVQSRLIPFLTQQGFEGEVLFRPNDAIPPHDAKLEWHSGRAERSTEALWQEIEALLADVSFLSSPPHSH
jgi:flagellar assembly protein FliH